MSGNTTQASHRHQHNPAKPRSNSYSEELQNLDAEELRRLDAIVDRTRNFIPEKPYILTIPTDLPYSHHSRDPNGWCRNTPFQPHEWDWQYTSFIYREHGESCIMSRTEMDIERETRERDHRMNGTPVVKPTLVPPVSGAAKKKISLGDYNKKRAGGGAPESTNGLVKDIKKEDAEITNGTTNAHVKDEKARGTRTTVPDRGAKRSLDDGEDHKGWPPDLPADNPPSSKRKRKAEPSSPPQGSGMDVPYDLPPKISPPRVDSPGNIPAMLSPSLPAVIEEALIEFAANSNPPSAEKKPRPAENTNTPDRLPTTTKAESVSKSLAQAAKKPAPSATRPVEAKKQPSSAVSVTSKVHRDDTEVRGTSERSATPKKKKNILIVKLKYPKKLKVSIERILKMTPKSKNTHGKKDSLEPATKKLKLSEESKNRAVQLSDSERKVPEKRPRASDDSATSQAPSKRTKAPPALDATKITPRTPVQPSIPSPSLSSVASTQRNQHVTPSRKDLHKATGMMRTTSTDSLDAMTTPAATTPQASKSVASATSAPQNAASAAWLSVRRETYDLARKLKSEGRAVLESGTSAPSRSHKKGCIMEIESLLSFMLSFTAGEYMARAEHKPLTIRDWKTLTQTWMAFKAHCREYPGLQGFMWHLGAVIWGRVGTVIGTQSRGKDTDPARELAELAEAWSRMQDCSREAHSRLSVEMMMDQFPETWRRRERVSRVGVWESLPPGDARGPYFLPLGIDSTPLQIVRMGLVFLKEWMHNEGVDYELRLRLG